MNNEQEAVINDAPPSMVVDISDLVRMARNGRPGTTNANRGARVTGPNETERHKKALVKAAMSVDKCPEMSSRNFSGSYLNSMVASIAAGVACVNTDALKPLVDQGKLDENDALVTDAVRIRAAKTLSALQIAWPQHDVTCLKGLDLLRHSLAFAQFAVIANGHEPEHDLSARCAAWLDSLDGPIATTTVLWDMPAESMAATNPSGFEQVFNTLLGSLLGLITSQRLGSVAHYRDVMSTCDKAEIYAVFPWAEGPIKWTLSILASVAKAPDLATLAPQYKQVPYHPTAIAVLTANTQWRGLPRLVRKVLKLVQLAFRARIEEIVGNLPRDAKTQSKGQHEGGARPVNMDENCSVM